jgi:6-phosphogluconolactonase
VIYVSNPDSREIHVLNIDQQSGALRLIQRTEVPGAVVPLAISPNGRFLYASLRSVPFSVSTLAIDPVSGELSLLSTVPLSANMGYLSTDKTGRFLFGASYPDNKISINRIGPQGLVEAQPVQVIPTPPHAHAIMTDRSNRYLFVPSLGGDVILQFKFDSAIGHVTPNTPPFVETQREAGPRHLVFHPNDRFAYSTNEHDATVSTFRYDAANGTLARVGTDSILPPDFKGHGPFAGADIHMTPDGRYLYASECTAHTITGFRVDGESGVLTAIGHFPTEAQPRGFNIDPRGRYLLAVGRMSNRMTSYAINGDTGVLALQHQHPMGEKPSWVEIIDIPHSHG